MKGDFVPSLYSLTEYKKEHPNTTVVVPVYERITHPLPDPLNCFIKYRGENNKGFKNSVFWECTEENHPTERSYSVIAAEPWKILTSGRDTDMIQGDPLPYVEQELSQFVVPDQFKLSPPILNGAALGYIGYDCVKYFEPRVAQYQQSDTLKLPESLLMFYNSFLYLDYKSPNNSKIVALCIIDDNLETNYADTVNRIDEIHKRILRESTTDPYENNPSKVGPYISNAGSEGYQQYVKTLKEYIVDGYIIQAVPSQRWERESGIHPFNFFKQMREINPSRYTFYIECGEFEIIGASPELLVKLHNNRLINHPIAGTRKRGATPEEDIALEKELISNEKERAEHIMLVDLGRNDVNRVCIPETTNVDSLMHIEYFSHVMHIVSQVSGTLREECTPFDAFRSIFPAGTVSGAPKVKAMELVASLEKEKRGIYAGAVGYFSFDKNIDTCIAIRTALYKNGKYYFQSGGGIVYDSDPNFENDETYHKRAALSHSLEEAEKNQTLHRVSESPLYRPNPFPLQTLFSSKFPQLSSLSLQTPIPTLSTPSRPLKSYPGGKTLLIDNYDSFTWNLYQYLSKLGENVIVYRHDKITVPEAEALHPNRLVISPGPGWPKDAGISNDLLKSFFGKIPILGVCLGHECLVEIYGGEITHCGEVKHGKTSIIKHDGKGVYTNLPEKLEVIRYHSLAANVNKIPKDFYVTSRTDVGVIMGIRHEKFRVEGVQFHPESIKTDHGLEMLKNFLTWETPEW